MSTIKVVYPTNAPSIATLCSPELKGQTPNVEVIDDEDPSTLKRCNACADLESQVIEMESTEEGEDKENCDDNQETTGEDQEEDHKELEKTVTPVRSSIARKKPFTPASKLAAAAQKRSKPRTKGQDNGKMARKSQLATSHVIAENGNEITWIDPYKASVNLPVVQQQRAKSTTTMPPKKVITIGWWVPESGLYGATYKLYELKEPHDVWWSTKRINWFIESNKLEPRFHNLYLYRDNEQEFASPGYNTKTKEEVALIPKEFK